MKIKGVAFDLEGTVVDVEKAHHEGHIATAHEVGVELLNLDDALNKLPHFIGGPDDKIVEEIWELSSKIKDKAFLSERDIYHYHRLLKEMDISPRAGFLKILKELRNLGIKISIGSLTGKEEAEVLLRASGLDKVFDREHTVLREDVKNIKPAPDVFLKTARCMCVLPSNQLVFEDSPRGVMAAKSAGSIAVGMPVYNKPKAIESLKEAGAVRIFMSWEEINIKELFNFLNEKA